MVFEHQRKAYPVIIRTTSVKVALVRRKSRAHNSESISADWAARAAPRIQSHRSSDNKVVGFNISSSELKAISC